LLVPSGRRVPRGLGRGGWWCCLGEVRAP
jgi:hypothetical protein